jgi:hypothetical protein
LKLNDRDDKVPITLIPVIEAKLKTFAINVRGDYIYTSPIQSHKVINLLLQNEHYTVDRSYNIKHLTRVSYNEKKIMLYDRVTFEGYNGIEKRKLSKEEYKHILYNYQSEYVLIDREEREKVITIEDEYKELIEAADSLKKATFGVINLYKTGNITNTALDLFERFTKYIDNPDQIEQDEAEWIQNATVGAIIWADKYQGPAYKYDVKSQYPSIYKSSGKFPIKRGTFMIINTLENVEYFQYGIYRCVISKSDDPDINKLFRFNSDHYYTHTSMEHAKSLGLKIDLIQDGKVNFLYYPRDCLISFDEVFDKYTNYLFDLKDKKIPKAKDIINRIWGALSQKNKKSYFNDNIREINITSDEDLYMLRPYKDNEDYDVIETTLRTNKFKTNFARLCPFLISRARYNISKIIQPFKSEIKRIHTDGFISISKLDIKTGEKLGDLKYEGYCENCIIKNCSNKSGEFII